MFWRDKKKQIIRKLWTKSDHHNSLNYIHVTDISLSFLKFIYFEEGYWQKKWHIGDIEGMI